MLCSVIWNKIIRP